MYVSLSKKASQPGAEAVLSNNQSEGVYISMKFYWPTTPSP